MVVKGRGKEKAVDTVMRTGCVECCKTIDFRYLVYSTAEGNS